MPVDALDERRRERVLHAEQDADLFHSAGSAQAVRLGETPESGSRTYCSDSCLVPRAWPDPEPLRKIRLRHRPPVRPVVLRGRSRRAGCAGCPWRGGAPRTARWRARQMSCSPVASTHLFRRILIEVVGGREGLAGSRRVQEVAVLVEVAVEELRDVERAAHRHAPGEDVGMAQRQRHRVIRAEAAAGDADRAWLVRCVNERHDVVQEVVLVLQVPLDPVARVDLPLRTSSRCRPTTRRTAAAGRARACRRARRSCRDPRTRRTRPSRSERRSSAGPRGRRPAAPCRG